MRRLGQHRRVAGEAAGEFRDAAYVDRVVVAPREQRSGRRAHRGDGEAVVTQTLCRRPVVGGGPDRAAEGARVAEPGVVNEDEQDVWGAPAGGFTWPINPSPGCEPPRVLFVTPRTGGRRMGSTVRSTWSFMVNRSPMVGHQLRAERVFGHRAALSDLIDIRDQGADPVVLSRTSIPNSGWFSDQRSMRRCRVGLVRPVRAGPDPPSRHPDTHPRGRRQRRPRTHAGGFAV